MSGHSKWHSIRHKKGANDAKRGKIFTRHAKLIEIAAREGGGGDPDSNPQLRTAIDAAKAENVPNANIDRAVKKGTGELKDGSQTVEVVYECYGPEGTAYLIECLTDNKNRTLPNVKTIINKKGGRFAESGSVGWMFERKGIVSCEIGEDTDRDAMELAVIDAGAEDIDMGDTTITITTSRESWGAVRDVMKQHGCDVSEAGLKYIASQPVDITSAEAAEHVMQFMEALDEDEDVSEVHTNANIADDAISHYN